MISSQNSSSDSPDTTSQLEISALANIYRFVLDRAEKEATRPGGPDDAKEIKNGSRHGKYTR